MHYNVGDEDIIEPTQNPATDMEEGILTSSMKASEAYTAPPVKRMDSTPNETPVILKSTHLIFFKIYDYIDFTLETRETNFLLFFRSAERAFEFSLASMIVIAQALILSNLVRESTDTCADEDHPKMIWMGVILCALRAANSFTTAFLSALPYEIAGTNLAEAEVLIERVNESKIEKKDLFSDDRHRSKSFASSSEDNATSPLQTTLEPTLGDKLVQLPPERNASERLMERGKVFATEAVSRCYLYSVAFGLQLLNFLLFLTICGILGTASDYTSLVTQFVSIETITHVHEIIPRAMRMKDKSPQLYNMSGVDLEEALESSGRLAYGQIVPKGPDGKGGVYRYSARMHRNLLFSFFFVATYGVYFAVSTSCEQYRKWS